MKNPTTLRLAAFAALIAAAALAGCQNEEVHADAGGNPHGRGGPPAPARPAPAPLSGARCAVHDEPVGLCFICDATLRDKGRLWCEEHKRYEDRCWECHPELQDPQRPWCREHSLYVDECFLCRPELRGQGRTAASGAPLMCAEHGVPEAECAVCRPELAARLKPGESLKVRLPSTNSAAIIGVETAPAESGTIVEGVACVAEVSFNLNKLAQIAAPVSGLIQSVNVDLGSQVEEKQPVAEIWSASIAEAVAKAVLSHQTLDRERRLRADRVTSEASLQEAEAAHRTACQQLRTLGFTEAQIEELGKQPQEQVLMEVRAPFAGEIVERMAVRGALIEPGKPLFTLVDHSTVWAMLQVPEAALARVQVGQAVELRVDSLPRSVFTGRLTWIGPAVDERTRMARARAEFANPNRLLKDKMFARAKILTRHAEGAMVVSPSAIQYVEGKPFVFVRLGEDLFAARAVSLGAKSDGIQEVLAGLEPREPIAVRHAFAIKSAMLVSRLGAGCADD